METKRFLGEVKRQLKLAGPLVLATSIQFIIQLISNMFVGHLGTLPLAGAAMATSFASVTGFTVMIGMSSALDTLCGQAYGARQEHMLGIHLQRAMVILTLTGIPISLIWAFAGQILSALHQDHQIAAEAGLYARWLIPSLFGFGLLQCYTKFLQTQNVVLPVFWTSCFVAILHVLDCWILVFRLGLGSKGAAIAISISYWVNVLLLALYVKLSSTCKTTWTGFSRKAFNDINNFIKLAIPSTLMICLGCWAYEALVILSGLLPNPKLQTSVMSITISTATMIVMIFISMGAAVSTRVSNELGAGNAQVARFAVFTGVVVTLIEGTATCVVLLCVRNIWGRAFSTDRDVIDSIARIIPILAPAQFLDGVLSVLQGTARGCGWQTICVYINIGSYYIVGIPISVLLAFVLHTGAKGLWIGMIVSAAVQSLILAAITLRTDWNKEVDKVRDRVNEAAIPAQTTSKSTSSTATVNEAAIPAQTTSKSISCPAT